MFSDTVDLIKSKIHKLEQLISLSISQLPTLPSFGRGGYHGKDTIFYCRQSTRNKGIGLNNTKLEHNNLKHDVFVTWNYTPLF
jgi:hypothetical protein